MRNGVEGMTAEDRTGPAEWRYAFKPSISGAARQFTLTNDALVWTAGRQQGTWAYRDIAAVRMSFRPMSMQANRFRTDVRHRSGYSLSILSVTWQGIAVIAPQSAAYRAFVVELHRRIAAANPAAEFRAGLPPFSYGIASALIVAVAVALAGLLARALATSAFAGAAFIAGMGVLFGWPFANFMQRNQPGHYTPESPPERLLPKRES